MHSLSVNIVDGDNRAGLPLNPPRCFYFQYSYGIQQFQKLQDAPYCVNIAEKQRDTIWSILQFLKLCGSVAQWLAHLEF